MSEENHEPEDLNAKFEVTVFVENPAGFVGSIKAIGGFEVFDDLDGVLAERGYKPDTRKGGGSSAPASSGSGKSSSGGGSKPKEFELDGTTWYVNFSEKKKTYYIGRKANGKMEFLDKSEAPDYIKEAYGWTR